MLDQLTIYHPSLILHPPSKIIITTTTILTIFTIISFLNQRLWIPLTTSILFEISVRKYPNYPTEST
jgi:hypothetical protein